MTMLSPSNNVKFTTMNPPVEFWQAMEKMQENWINFMKGRPPHNATDSINFTSLTPPPPPLFPGQYPEPGAIASQVTFGVSWMNVPLGFIQILVSGLGLYGIYEENDAKYFLPYLIWNIVNPVIFFLMGILSPMGSAIASFLMCLIQFGLYAYFLMVVYSYYSALKLKPRYHKAASHI